ncbi:hypothetical protein ABT340_26565 [Streptosporangium sp. NPDC000239]|uniref:hypothetical protein n=1 Tax=Streptosporangium sp. NPDC000239 TaxID=3154248 RepID=UPI003322ED33
MRFGRFTFKQPAHQAMIGPTGVYYVFTFDLGASRKYEQVAAKLLRLGIAESAITAASPQVIVTPKFKQLLHNKHKALKVSDFNAAIHRGSWPVIIKESIRSPSLGRSVARLAVSYYASRLLRHKIPVAKIEPEESIREDSFTEKLNADLREAVDIIDDSMRNKLMYRGLDHAIDRKMFAPGYLQDNPFIRLQLKPFQGNISGQTDGTPFGNSKSWIDVDLVLYHSGIAQLCFSIAFESSSMASRFNATSAKGVIIPQSRLCEEILKPYVRSISGSLNDLSGTVASDIEGGSKWWTLSSTETTTLSDIFNIYDAAIRYSCRIRNDATWFCYTLICIESLECRCRSRDDWMVHHKKELAGLAARVGWHENISERGMQKFLPEDLFETVSSSLYASFASAVRINWSFVGSADEVEYSHVANLHDLTAISYSLAGYQQAKRLDRAIRGSMRSSRHLDSQVEEFAELRHGVEVLTYGTAREIAEHVDSSLGVPSLYQRTLTNLEMKRDVLAAIQAKRASRRANVTAAAALVAAAIIALPNVDDGLKVVANIDTSNGVGRIAAPLKEIAAQGANGTWMVYLAVLAIFIGVIAIPWSSRRRTWNRRVRLGWRWPEEVTVELSDDEV